jgi:hypothetical protein
MHFVKNTAMVLLVVLVSFGFSQRNNTVKSKQGPIDLTKDKGGKEAVCTAGFNDNLTLLREDGSHALVKMDGCQGWVAMSAVVRVNLAGDKAMALDEVDVVGWLDNPSAVFVLDQDAAEFDGINIDRDMKEYLRHTMDRERIEMQNAEN